MKKSNNKNGLSEFARYIRGEMSKREENAFQRKLQRDPFADEAAEGLSQLSADEAVSDLRMLESRLERRVSGSRRLMFYRIAASVAVLMIISSVYFILNRDKPAREMAKTAAVTATEKMDEAGTAAEDKKESQVPEMVSGISGSQAVPAEEPSASREDAAETLAAGNEAEAATEEVIIAEALAEEVTAMQETAVSRAAAEPVTVLDAGNLAGAPAAAMKALSPPEARGVIISSEDNLPVPDATITIKGTRTTAVTDTEGRFRIPLTDTAAALLVADFIGMERQEVRASATEEMKISMTPAQTSLSEVVVVGYGTGGAGDSEEDAYIPAQPETGRNEFNEYIEGNIRKPASLPSGQRVVVVLGFTVRSTGAIENIKVIRSPGQEFSDEAVRLIREGPGWIPAVENGEKTDDEVRIRIVFK